MNRYKSKLVLLLALVFVGVMFGCIWLGFTKLFSHGPQALPYAHPLTSMSPEATKLEPKSFTILFGGDLMFDRHIRQSMDRNGPNFILEPLRQTLLSYDLVVANLEGPITTFPSKSVGSAVGSTNNFLFTFPISVVPMLKEYNFGLVSLANNHIRNFDVEGIDQTKSFLTQENVGFFGNTGEELLSEQRVKFIEREGKKLAFVGVNQFVSGGFEAGEEDVIFARRNADIVIVFPHWGNEYQPNSGPVIEEYAHRLVDLGADLIIGSHPHVIQQVEEYHGKMVYYSLGNFVFDQYFEPAVKKGMLVAVEVHPDNVLTFSEIPIELKVGGQTMLGTP